MATSPIGATPNIAATAASSLKLEDLLKVLLTELTHQDPFKPVDNKDFMAQIAQFASLDSSRQLNQSIEQLISLQAVNQTVGLLGRQVSATTNEGTINGKVIALSLLDGTPRMDIDSAGQIHTGIAISQLVTIR